VSASVSNAATSDTRRGNTGRDGAIVIGGDYRGLGLARSLGRRGVPVWVLWEREERLATASRYVRRSLPICRHGEPLREELLRVAREESAAGWTLFPTSDHTVAAIARDYDELAGMFRLTTPPWDVLHWAHDKRLTQQLAEQAGVQSPRTFFPADRGELTALECEFPVILKPAVKEEFNRFTAAKAWRVDDRRSLVARYDEACLLVPPETIMVQELIPGDGRCQFSFAALCSAGKPLASVVARRTRQFPSDFGRASTFVESIDEPAVSAEAQRLLAQMGVTGLVEVEFKRDPRSRALKLLDINPRAWGWHTLGARAGVDFPYLLWRLAHDDPVRGLQGIPGIKWKRLSWDLFAVASDLRGSRLALRDYLASFRGPRVAAIFAADDPLPGLVEAPLLFLTLFARLARGKGV
jgi:predicted ATP-grasp superfamily ATP-dependent carboligase